MLVQSFNFDFNRSFQLKSLSEQHEKSIFQIQELKMKLSEVSDDQKVQVKNLNEVEEKVSACS